MNIHTAAFGNFAVGPVNTGGGKVGTSPPHIQPTSGFVEIKIDRKLVCENTNRPRRSTHSSSAAGSTTTSPIRAVRM